MKYAIFTIMAAAALLAGGGCGKAEYPPPPSGRNDLVLRFFQSMKNHDAASAAIQGEKIAALDASNDDINKLVAIQQGNVFVQRAQQALNRGDADEALQIMEEGVKTFPMARHLATERGRVRQLRNAGMLLESMGAAKSSAEMASAATMAETGLSLNMTPALKSYISEYRQKIKTVAAAERENAVKSVVATPHESTQKIDAENK